MLLEAAKVHDVVRFVHVSTDEVYGEGESMETAPMIEDHVLEPTNPYAATKAAAEFLVKSYHRSFGLPVIITRGNNVYGPHQFPEKLIPKFTNQRAPARTSSFAGPSGRGSPPRHADRGRGSRRRRGTHAAHLHGISTWQPRRRRDSSPWNIHVAAAAAPRPVGGISTRCRDRLAAGSRAAAR